MAPRRTAAQPQSSPAFAISCARRLPFPPQPASDAASSSPAPMKPESRSSWNQAGSVWNAMAAPTPSAGEQAPPHLRTSHCSRGDRIWVSAPCEEANQNSPISVLSGPAPSSPSPCPLPSAHPPPSPYALTPDSDVSYVFPGTWSTGVSSQPHIAPEPQLCVRSEDLCVGSVSPEAISPGAENTSGSHGPHGPHCTHGPHGPHGTHGIARQMSIDMDEAADISCFVEVPLEDRAEQEWQRTTQLPQEQQQVESKGETQERQPPRLVRQRMGRQGESSSQDSGLTSASARFHSNNNALPTIFEADLSRLSEDDGKREYVGEEGFGPMSVDILYPGRGLEPNRRGGTAESGGSPGRGEFAGSQGFPGPWGSEPCTVTAGRSEPGTVTAGRSEPGLQVLSQVVLRPTQPLAPQLSTSLAALMAVLSANEGEGSLRGEGYDGEPRFSPRFTFDQEMEVSTSLSALLAILSVGSDPDSPTAMASSGTPRLQGCRTLQASKSGIEVDGLEFAGAAPVDGLQRQGSLDSSLQQYDNIEEGLGVSLSSPTRSLHSSPFQSPARTRNSSLHSTPSPVLTRRLTGNRVSVVRDCWEAGTIRREAQAVGSGLRSVNEIMEEGGTAAFYRGFRGDASPARPNSKRTKRS